MHNFFIKKENFIGDKVKIDGADFNHVKNVLRMKKGEQFLVSFDGKSSLCELECFENDCALATIIQSDFQDTSLPIEIYLFQGLPKSDKLELIIQKAVELGAHQIIPVQMERCIAKIESNKVKQKTERFNAIAESSAKQSKRTIIPMVSQPLSFKNALEMAKQLDLFLIPYENEQGIFSTKNALSKIKKGNKVGVLIGPEGGFSQNEIDLAREVGTSISLGKRILRTETASITAISMLMLHAEMNLE
ncbi:MAG: 16S rRNA (uracil(1498)-N(3))-methyltransferase [Clostridia bacterium]|nr:16S rRNA (uracil(1498)-N(3))-methyltransferase [Clostridia bacterium]